VVVDGDHIEEDTVADLEVEEAATVPIERVAGQSYCATSCQTIFSCSHDIRRGRGRGF
jgi:hypothetical protein